MPYIPSVIERTARGERGWDLFSRLLNERVIMLSTPIDDDVASSIVAQLLYLQHQDPTRDVWVLHQQPRWQCA
jgi:ATP-dependent Clp protease protease subunit